LTAEAIAKDSWAGIAPAEIACVVYRSGSGCTCGRGRTPRRPAIGADTRARAYIDRWLADGVDRAIRPKTMQAIWPAQPNALLAWMRDHEPESLRRAAANLTCKDYIRLRLTGEIWQERTDMSGCSLINAARATTTPTCSRFIAELRRIAALEAIGPVRIRHADAAVAPVGGGTPVAGGMFDIDACGLASGMVDETQLCMIVGTWGNNQYISRQPVVHETVFMTTCYAIAGYYLMLEGSATSASNLEWFVSEFWAERDQMARRRRQCTSCATRWWRRPARRVGHHLLAVFVWLQRSLDGKAGFWGLDGWQNRGHVLRAIYEGIVFSHRWHMERLLQFRPPPERIRLSGGAARSEVWVQMFADILQIPVEVPAAPKRLGAPSERHGRLLRPTVRLCRVVHARLRTQGAPTCTSQCARYRKLLGALHAVSEWSGRRCKPIVIRGPAKGVEHGTSISCHPYFVHFGRFVHNLIFEELHHVS
jgi:L-xylulokinase